MLSAVQVRPQMKWVRRGREQGSVEKFHVATHDHGGMVFGLMAALKACKAEISEGRVTAWPDSVVKRRQMCREK